MTKLISKPRYGTPIITSVFNRQTLSPEYQRYFDDIERLINDSLLGQQIMLPSYSVVDLPDPSPVEGGIIYVSDALGGAEPAFSDGTDWRRFSDRTIIT